MKNCFVKNCELKYYAKGLCRNHYMNRLRNGNTGEPEFKTIKVYTQKCFCGSQGIVRINNKIYCQFHYYRIRNKIPFYRPKGVTGKLNTRWNGGTSEYKNHYLFKKNRLQKFKQTNYKCETCGAQAEIAHHKDHSKINHNLENLQALCKKCHFKHHKGRKNKNTIWTRTYGQNMKETAMKLNRSTTWVWRYHKTGQLKNILKMSCN